MVVILWAKLGECRAMNWRNVYLGPFIHGGKIALWLLCGFAVQAHHASWGSASEAEYAVRAQRVLAASPLIDGHNDLPWEIRERFKGDWSAFDLHGDTSKLAHAAGASPLMTDIPRLRTGGVGAQFWSVWVPSDLPGPEAVQITTEQIDLVKTMTARYADTFVFARTSADIRRATGDHKIAALIGIEGGHQINNQLAVLRQFYELGARYMTLTHSRNTAWADSATDTPIHKGLTPFGKEVVREMNRLGMLVDISHVSPDTMRDALDATVAPVIFSHSSARAVTEHPRNIPNNILLRLKNNGGVAMINFFPGYVSLAYSHWEADRAGEQARLSSPPFVGLYLGQPELAAAQLQRWDEAHPKPIVTLSDVVKHAVHMRDVAGIDHIGIGSDFDGIPEGPIGLASVEDYPKLLVELMRVGWSDEDLRKLTGGNILRVLRDAEVVAQRLRATQQPSSGRIEVMDASLKGASPSPPTASATSPVPMHVATFDSGFGGYLTAKSIERAAMPLLADYDTEITIHHYGDTKNLPYGAKTPEQIAALGSAGVLKAFREGADIVFIACNTASTQYAKIRQAVDEAYPGAARPVLSIIDVSTREAKQKLDLALAEATSATLVILATPATVKSMVYPQQLAALYGASLAADPARSFTQPRWYAPLGQTVQSLTQKSVIALPGDRHIDVYQLAPANWVELIEHGADLKQRHDAVHRDLALLLAQITGGAAPDVVGYFCTHYPILDGLIRAEMTSQRGGNERQVGRTSYISQAALMANLFRSMATERLKGHARVVAADTAALAALQERARASITISGRNGSTTRALARAMFPADPEPMVVEEDLDSNPATPATQAASR